MTKTLIPRVSLEQEQIALKQLAHRADVGPPPVPAFCTCISAQIAAVQGQLHLHESNLTLPQHGRGTNMITSKRQRHGA